MNAKPIFTLQIKGSPLISLAGDSRPWALDVYGMHDGFATPVEDPDGPELGPPTMRIPAGDSGRFNPCMIPTVARLQGYDAAANLWQRVATNSDGQLVTRVDGFVSILPPAVTMAAGVVTIGAVETLLLAANIDRRYVRFEIPAAAVDVWVSPAGAGTAVVGSGIRLLPGVAYTLDSVRFSTSWVAISAVGNVQVAFTEGIT